MLPRQTMRICSHWRRCHCFCCPTDKIGKPVVPAVILAIANVSIIIISGRVGMQALSYCTTINEKHDNARNHHRQDLPLSLINQHVESINDVICCMPLPRNKGKLNEPNKEFAHADLHIILCWAAQWLLPLSIDDDPTIAMITFKPNLPVSGCWSWMGDTIGLVKKQVYNITGPTANKEGKKSHNTDRTGLRYRLHWKRKYPFCFVLFYYIKPGLVRPDWVPFG